MMNTECPATDFDAFRERLRVAEQAQKRRDAVTRLRHGLSLVPWSSFVLLLLIALLFKAFVVLRIGEDRVSDKLAAYRDPGMAERIGIVLMTPDPVTRNLGQLVGSVIAGRH